MDEDHEFYVVGDRVYIDGYRAASVVYFGETDFAPGDWVGAVLDEPTGNHNGKFHGRKYFQCPPNHGILVRPQRVSRSCSDSRSSRSSSRLSSTPLPTFQHFCDTPERFLYDYDYLDEPSYLSRRTGRQSTRRGSTTVGDGHNSASRKGRFTSPELGSQTHPSSNFKDRLEDLTRRIRSASVSPAAQAPVFNFRPKRIPLEEREETPDMNAQDLKKGDTVLVRLEGDGRRELSGILRYLGETDFAHGLWAGVELDTPEGRNDGSVMNCRYFHCPMNYGLFLPVSRVRKYTSRGGTTTSTKLETVRSTIKSPPPLASALYVNSHLNDYCFGKSSLSPQKDDSRRGDYSSGFDSASPALETESGRSSVADSRYNSRRPLFNDDEIDVLLKRSIERNLAKPSTNSTLVKPRNEQSTRFKSITHTFTSSKYNGNPTVRRIIEYL